MRFGKEMNQILFQDRRQALPGEQPGKLGGWRNLSKRGDSR